MTKCGHNRAAWATIAERPIADVVREVAEGPTEVLAAFLAQLGEALWTDVEKYQGRGGAWIAVGAQLAGVSHNCREAARIAHTINGPFVRHAPHDAGADDATKAPEVEALSSELVTRARDDFRAFVEAMEPRSAEEEADAKGLRDALELARRLLLTREPLTTADAAQIEAALDGSAGRDVLASLRVAWGAFDAERERWRRESAG